MIETVQDFVIETNNVIETCRLIVGVMAGVLAIALFIRWMRQPTYVRVGLVLFSLLVAFDEYEQVGEPYVLYRLPIRAVALLCIFIGIYKDGPRDSTAKHQRTRG